MPRTDPRPVDLDTLPLQPQRCMHVLALILRRHNWQHAIKAKNIGHRTAQARGRLCVWVFRFLHHNPAKAFKLDPRSFSGRHADFVLAHWCAEAKAGRLAPGTIPTYYSHLKTFTRWIGKPKLLKPIRAYFDDPALYRRSGITTNDKSWRALGVDLASVIRDVVDYDVHAAASLWLMLAFGLRFKESLMLRPHVDVATACQAKGDSGSGGNDESGAVQYLDTHRGTKGGRQRYVPIDDALCRHAIAYACHVAKGRQGSVSDPNLTLVQALRRLRYVMERFGITKRDLRVVPHGLRHQFAASRYTERTGALPPVAGGPGVAPDADSAARQHVSALLGHGRPQITNAYLGQSAAMRRKPALGASGASKAASDST
ncbi:MAG: integrase domain-containing protein [Aquincola sp.]|nr:integrase domain-containing protein [Aquincola sp.]